MECFPFELYAKSSATSRLIFKILVDFFLLFSQDPTIETKTERIRGEEYGTQLDQHHVLKDTSRNQKVRNVKCI